MGAPGRGAREGGGPPAEALRPGCALELQDISLTLPPSGCAGRLQRDTSTTLAGGLQRRDPSLRLGGGGVPSWPAVAAAPPAQEPLHLGQLPVLDAGVPSWC